MSTFIVLLMIIFNLVIQTTIIPMFPIMGIVPNTALVLIVVVALKVGRTKGAIFGLIAGFMQDVLFSSTIGINAFILFFIGYVIGFAENSFSRENIINPIIFTIAATMFYNFTYSLFLFFLSRDVTFIDAISSIFSIEILYNTLFAVIYGYLVHIIFTRPKIRFKR
ncbi:MAG: rod shape-determining protein MreD [Gudongella sp.]|nr:rod shape-determining protein MreD [Gudongella sp.]